MNDDNTNLDELLPERFRDRYAEWEAKEHQAILSNRQNEIKLDKHYYWLLECDIPEAAFWDSNWQKFGSFEAISLHRIKRYALVLYSDVAPYYGMLVHEVAYASFGFNAFEQSPSQEAWYLRPKKFMSE